MDVCIIGAGISGLSTAIALQELFSRHEIESQNDHTAFSNYDARYPKCDRKSTYDSSQDTSSSCNNDQNYDKQNINYSNNISTASVVVNNSGENDNTKARSITNASNNISNINNSSKNSSIVPPSRFLKSLTIVADKMESETVSYGSQGLVCAYPPHGIPEHIGRLWAADSKEYFLNLAYSEDASTTGVNLNSGFLITDTKDNPVLHSMIHVREMTDEERSRFECRRKYKHGYAATAVFVEMPSYLSWMTSKFKADGGKLVRAKVKNLHELADKYDVIVNCTGIGSIELTSDPFLRPLRGQVVHLEAPWIKNWVCYEEDISIFPFSRSVSVGAVRQVDNTNLAVADEDNRTILSKAIQSFPPLKKARVLYSWVGLRPQRHPVRLEKEIIHCKGKQLKVVHNYGHGPYGVSLSRGCALYAAKLVKEMMTSQTSKL